MGREQRREAQNEKREFWKTHIEGWRASGITQKEYCHRNELKLHRFHYWRKKYTRTIPPQGPSIVEVGMTGALTSLLPVRPSPMHLVVDGGHRTELRRDFDPVALEQLLQVLDRR